jgi:hypothetical protein
MASQKNGRRGLALLATTAAAVACALGLTTGASGQVGGTGETQVGTAPLSVLDDSSCPQGWGCVWTGTNYNGNKTLIESQWGGTGWQTFPGNGKQSAKNGFTNRKLLLRIGPGWAAACLTERGTPGDHVPDFGGLLVWQFRVTDPGGGCGS